MKIVPKAVVAVVSCLEDEHVRVVWDPVGSAVGGRVPRPDPDLGSGVGRLALAGLDKDQLGLAGQGRALSGGKL